MKWMNLTKLKRDGFLIAEDLISRNQYYIVYSPNSNRYKFYYLNMKSRKKLTSINQTEIIKLFQTNIIRPLNNRIKININLSRYIFRIEVKILPDLNK